MRGSGVILAVAVALLAGFGIGQTTRSPGAASTPIAEGVIWTVEYVDGEGKSHGMTRASLPEAGPGGSGSWNMDIYGRLYSTHLEITLPKSKDLGPQIIPMHRIVQVQFGHGGITKIGSN